MTADAAASRKIVFYSKTDCPLCDKGLPIVEDLARRFGLKVEKIDILAADPDVLQRHRYRIPVVEFRGQELGWGRLSREELERRLEVVV